MIKQDQLVPGAIRVKRIAQVSATGFEPATYSAEPHTIRPGVAQPE